MAARIKFDNAYNPLPPTLVLASRNGEKHGIIPAVNINTRNSMTNGAELQFRVYKDDNWTELYLWDEIRDFKLAWCPEWDIWFEIKVDLTDGDGLYKNVSCTSIGEAELSQINLYGIEINTEDDIARDDYLPTVLYDKENPKASLLNRIGEKIPHYSIGHVDKSIASIQRTFSFDSKSILDALYEIGEEIGCLFIIDSGSNSDGKPARVINAYDLAPSCNTCGHRGQVVHEDAIYGGFNPHISGNALFANGVVFLPPGDAVYLSKSWANGNHASKGRCANCGGEDIYYGFGEYTNIYISKENLANEITYSSSTESVKNCFKLEGGDDLMTATIMNCNPNGSSYLWYISDELRDDMSDALRDRLSEYDSEYSYYTINHVFDLQPRLLDAYNTLVRKYRRYDESLTEISVPVQGYPSLMNAYYNVLDFEIFLRDELMPSPNISTPTAEEEAARLVALENIPIAVTNIDICSNATASSAVLAVAKTIVDKGFQVKVAESVFENYIWTGRFRVANYSDEEDVATSSEISISITDDFEDYLRQRLSTVLKSSTDTITSATDLFKLSTYDFSSELSKYCLSSLTSLREICQSCLDVLIQQGVANKDSWADAEHDLYVTVYTPYYEKMSAIEHEIKARENELGILTGIKDSDGHVIQDGLETIIDNERKAVQQRLNFNSFFGDELMRELSAYRREDTYRNDNFVSDGLTNDEVFARAIDFINQASDEIYKSATLQHTITSSLKNLLVMKEFAQIKDSFEIGNWITLGVDRGLYRLRLTSYEIDYDNLNNVEVEYSDVVNTRYGKEDVASIVKSAASMSSSYNSVKRQASQGESAKARLDSIASGGLVLG